MTASKLTKITIDTYQQGLARELISYGFAKTPLGWIITAWQEDDLCYFNFAKGQDDAVALAGLQTSWPHNKRAQDDMRARHLVEKMFEGHHLDISVNLDISILLKGRPFQLDVWSALMELEADELISYGDIATRIGKSGGAQAVGQALNKNPICLLVPCHRVMARGGNQIGPMGGYAMGGYAHGADLKKKILQYEGIL